MPSLPTRGSGSSPGSRSSSPMPRTATILIVLCGFFLAFYIGVWVGIHASSVSNKEDKARDQIVIRQLSQLQQKVEDLSQQKMREELDLKEEEMHLKAEEIADQKIMAQMDIKEEEMQQKAEALAKRMLKVHLEAKEDEIQQKVEELAKQKVESQLNDLCKKVPRATTTEDTSQKKSGSSSNLISNSISHFVQGLVRVNKGDLMSTFDFGVPPNPGTEQLDALVLYNKKDAMPSDTNVTRAARYEDPTKPLPLITANQATENCDTMNVVFIDNPSSTRQCFALIGSQYQSYHIQRWMRRPIKHRGKVDAALPLILTSRGYTAAGKEEYPSPGNISAKRSQDRLLTYLTEIQSIRSRLKDVLKTMDQKTVVVITCNHGQSELLMNFACSSRARGFDLKNVIVFPTDQETKELSEGLGLSTFYEETIMASIPKKEAGSYGDSTFTSVMFAKVLCVQLVNELGYDLLFQDADVVWYKDPLEYFHDKSLPEFDIYFQDDGSRQERYAPYSANTGFYFVRSNDKTRHLFRHLLYSADLIDAWMSHQQALVALLAEHNSLFALRVKIFPKQQEQFPGGLHYHRKPDVMKKIINDTSDAFIFHMSWTQNKHDKLKFFQQMADWYLNDICIGKEAHDIITSGKDAKAMQGIDNENGILTKHCCSAEPLITCHYRDKPSKIPCPDSPFIGKAKGKSFW